MEGQKYRRLIQPWQQRALDYIDLIPEMSFASEFYARYLEKMHLFVGEYDPGDPDADPAPTEDTNISSLLDRIQDPGGGRTNLQGAYGRLRFVIGECYLIVTTDPDTDMERWEMVSPAELRLTAGGYTRFAAPGLPPEQLRDPPDGAFEALDPSQAVVYRLWKRHPKYSMLAQSSVQSCLDVCEELVALTQAVYARARSRLAGSGLLLIDEQLRDLSAAKNAEDDPFVQDFHDAITSPITNPDSSSAVVPQVVWGGRKAGQDLISILKVHDPTATYPETGLRNEAIARLANGLDFPREVLLGITDANHWSAWQIDETTWKAHIQPVVQAFVGDLTSAVLRPMLAAMNVANPERYTVWYDPRDIIEAPDQTQNAKDAWDRVIISDETARKVMGFDDEDAPDEEERNKRIGQLIRDSGLAVFGVPTLRSGSELEPKAGEIEAPLPQGGTEAPPGPGNVMKGPPPAGPPAMSDMPANGQPPVRASAVDVGRIIGACELAVERAREVAGSRIRGKVKDRAELSASVGDVPNRLVASTLGRSTVEALRGEVDAAKLVSGSTECLVARLSTWGIPTFSARIIAGQVEAHAAQTLYEAEPIALPASLIGIVA